MRCLPSLAVVSAPKIAAAFSSNCPSTPSLGSGAPRGARDLGNRILARIVSRATCALNFANGYVTYSHGLPSGLARQKSTCTVSEKPRPLWPLAMKHFYDLTELHNE